MKYCCVKGCSNDARHKHLAFHRLPVKNEALLKVWLTQMNKDLRNFNVNKHVVVCGEHFRPSDYKNYEANTRRLKNDAYPTIFSWTQNLEEDAVFEGGSPGIDELSAEDTVFEEDSSGIKELSACQREDEEATDSASEGEGDFIFKCLHITKNTNNVMILILIFHRKLLKITLLRDWVPFNSTSL